MKRIRTVFFVLVLKMLFLGMCSYGQEPTVYDTIVVTSRKSSSLEAFFSRNHAAEVLATSSIEQKSFNSLVDALDDVSGLDLRYRGTSGIQADLSARGSTFEQVAVSIDGIPVNDPQTGHHNLDIPLTSFDVERIEFVKEGVSSSLYKNALAGAVNVLTNKPSKKIFHLQTLFGEHALRQEAFSWSLPAEWLSSRFSFEHKSSKAARPNTDFESKTGSLYLGRELENSAWDVLWGYQEKDFGADSFYSNLFPEEEEHTRTLFVKTGWEYKSDPASSKANLYLRKHRDKFILNRNNPLFVNYHTTYVYGLVTEITRRLERGDFILGLETGVDQINSSNLGHHVQQHVASSLGLIPRIDDHLVIDLKTGFHEYQKWGFQESYNLGLGYFIIEEKLKIGGSLSRSFRIPSFTELYYSDAANQGNEQLEAETSDSFRLGLDFVQDRFSWGLEGFWRRGRHLIDWTRSSENDVWIATNLGRVDFSGLELDLGLKPGLSFKDAKIEKITFSYTYMDSDKKESGFLSKYALDILKHQFLCGVGVEILGIRFNCQLSYNQRCFGETYFVGDLLVSKRLKARDFIFEPFLKIDNFSNAHYSEVGGVVQPGRWIQGGVKFEW